MTKQQRALYEAVLASLLLSPGVWKRDRYRAEHPSGISVWVANGVYGLSIEEDGTTIVGGVTFLSTLFGPVIPWRVRLRRAALDIFPSGATVETALAALKGAA